MASFPRRGGKRGRRCLVVALLKDFTNNLGSQSTNTYAIAVGVSAYASHHASEEFLEIWHASIDCKGLKGYQNEYYSQASPRLRCVAFVVTRREWSAGSE